MNFENVLPADGAIQTVDLVVKMKVKVLQPLGGFISRLAEFCDLSLEVSEECALVYERFKLCSPSQPVADVLEFWWKQGRQRWWVGFFPCRDRSHRFKDHGIFEDLGIDPLSPIAAGFLFCFMFLFECSCRLCRILSDSGCLQFLDFNIFRDICFEHCGGVGA